MIFDQNLYTPEEFDKKGMAELVSRYRYLIDETKENFYKTRMFSSDALEEYVKSNVNWSLVVRHLILGFASSEALAHPPSDFLDLWVAYIRVRILPIADFNKSMQKYSLSPHIYERHEFLKIALYNIAAELLGINLLWEKPKGKEIWLTHAQMLGRVVQLAYEEVSNRFDKRILNNPVILLNKYETDHSPLFRSSILETQMRLISTVANIDLPRTEWLPTYEKLRQLLDDLADIKEDIEVGRLTFPVLIALQREGENGSLRKIIENHWDNKWHDFSHKKITCSQWEEIKKYLSSCGAISTVKDIILGWYEEAKSSIHNGELPGNTDSFLLMLELKRSFLSRLENNNYTDKEPEFNLGT